MKKSSLVFLTLFSWSLIFNSSTLKATAASLHQTSADNKHSEQQEFRGAWVPTVLNLSFPSRPGLTPEKQKREIITLLETARYARLNTLFVQVRPEADTFYYSPSEPWSRYLTGKQGSSPHFDPLQYFIEEGHRRGIAIHAWFNPYRAGMKNSDPRSALHISRRSPHFVRRIGKMLWLDPGDPSVQDYIVSVIRDVVRRYNIDGVHLDDYFYPYPEFLGGKSFPDATTYQRYHQCGGTLPLADWRRASVNALVKRLSTMIHQEKPGLLFGISPFGIYTKGQPNDVKAGLDQLHELYADPVLWMREGWIDYVAPQLYWKDKGPQSFTTLLRWWRNPEINRLHIPVYPGIALENLSDHHWPVQEIAQQLHIERTVQPRSHGGFILWNIRQLAENKKGVAPIVRQN